jgi:hypothetical protein
VPNVQDIADLDAAAELELKLDFWWAFSVPTQHRLSGSHLVLKYCQRDRTNLVLKYCQRA